MGRPVGGCLVIDASRLVLARGRSARLLSAVVVATLLASPPSHAQSLEPTVAPGLIQGFSLGLGGAPAIQDVWDGLRAGTFGVLDYGSSAVRAVTGWLTGTGTGDEVKTEDVRGLLSLSDKEFREFDTLVRAAGFVLQGYSFGLTGNGDVELSFDFERSISERERTELRRLVEQQGGVVNAVRRTILLGLLDATRYIDAAPASGYRLIGVTMRPGSPPDVRIKFRRNKP
jgi:hypothetical protein